MISNYESLAVEITFSLMEECYNYVVWFCCEFTEHEKNTTKLSRKITVILLWQSKESSFVPYLEFLYFFHLEIQVAFPEESQLR